MTDGLHLGSVDGSPFYLPLDALTTMTAIVGRRGSGKTTTALVLAEEFIDARLPVVLLDPLGVHFGLRSNVAGDGPGLPVTIMLEALAENAVELGFIEHSDGSWRFAGEWVWGPGVTMVEKLPIEAIQRPEFPA